MKRVKDLLEAKASLALVSVSPDMSVYEALQLMEKGNYGALPVLDSGVLVGILSERDCVRKVELKDKTSKQVKVTEIMTHDPLVVGPDHSLEECMTIMTEKGFRHLPVMFDDQPLGILSIKDIVKAVLADRDRFLNEVIEMGTQKDEEMIREKTSEVQKLADALKVNLAPLHLIVTHLKQTSDGPLVQDLEKVIQNLESSVRPVLESLEKEKRLSKTKVLLANNNRSEEVLAKLALGGTGVTLHTAESFESAREFMNDNEYDIVCVNQHFIEIAAEAKKKNDRVNTVFLTSEDAEHYLPTIRAYPFLSNVVSQNEGDRAFTIKSILATVSKITTSDYFGLEKYLSWGTEISERKIQTSDQRPLMIQEMSEYLTALGLRKTLVSRCGNVAEELLMNALYDAPVDAQGRQLYNHLERTQVIDLGVNNQATFRYGCDGMFLGISVRDPFGSLDRETIITYLESCFAGSSPEEHAQKAGGGHGLFIIMRSANMTIFNVKKGASTEVIALFDLEPKTSGKHRTSSFQYFLA